MQRWVIAKLGETLASLRPRLGDFEDWISQGCGLDPDETLTIDAFNSPKLPPLSEMRALVLTGSSAMVSEKAPWSEAVAAQLPEIIEAGIPVLGICYGHQLIAHSLGGRVNKNPKGREIGTISIELSEAASQDPLFSGLDATMSMHATHAESVLALPDNAVLLASSALDPHQAYRIGECTWGVQFHPEFTASIMRGYVLGRKDRLLDEGLPYDDIYQAIHEHSFGTELLRKFAKLVHR